MTVASKKTFLFIKLSTFRLVLCITGPSRDVPRMPCAGWEYSFNNVKSF